ncbi:MAG: response regulator [Moorea sp. SIO3C2]|nr:response regulator [Moorena sp. SIO3C2]
MFYGDREIHMTPKEYTLLELLVRHPHRVFSLDAIIDNLWSFEDPPSGDAVRTHIKGVRQKLKVVGAPKNFIETVYGVGYRLKELESEPLSTPQADPVPHSPTQDDMATAVAKAWENHQDTIQERLSVLEATAAALDGGHLSPELQHAGCAQAHKLAGSLGCFGFSEGSRLARELEQLLQVNVPLDGSHAGHVTSLVQGLRQNLTHGSSRDAIATVLTSLPTVMVFGASADFSQTLDNLGTGTGIRHLSWPDLAQAQYHIRQHPPDGVVLWLPQAAPTHTAASVLVELIARELDHKPLLVVSDVIDFHHRLTWVQQGVTRILPTSISPQAMVKDLRGLLQDHRAQSKVMIVDDDIQVLDFLTTILEPWGFQIQTLNDSTQLLETLAVVQPDLLVLDIEMPDANGLELCQVLRIDERWRHLPILFLTVHEDIQTRQDAFKVGADDFISKTLMVTDLPMRIVSRLQRSQD